MCLCSRCPVSRHGVAATYYETEHCCCVSQAGGHWDGSPAAPLGGARLVPHWLHKAGTGLVTPGVLPCEGAGLACETQCGSAEPSKSQPTKFLLPCVRFACISAVFRYQDSHSCSRHLCQTLWSQTLLRSPPPAGGCVVTTAQNGLEPARTQEAGVSSKVTGGEEVQVGGKTQTWPAPPLVLRGPLRL